MNINIQPISYEFKGSLTSYNADELKNELFKIVNDGNINLILTLSGVVESDVVGINALVMTHRLIRKFDGKLDIMITRNTHLDTLLHLTKFSHILTINYSN